MSAPQLSTTYMGLDLVSPVVASAGPFNRRLGKLIEIEAAGAGAVVHDVDERGFARVLRQRVDSAIVHHVSRTLPDGTRATASVRRGADGVLYSTTEPDSSRERTDGLGRALRDLERCAREAVGLPTL